MKAARPDEDWEEPKYLAGWCRRTRHSAVTYRSQHLSVRHLLLPPLLRREGEAEVSLEDYRV